MIVYYPGELIAKKGIGDYTYYLVAIINHIGNNG